jgi:hypothetical protein
MIKTAAEVAKMPSAGETCAAEAAKMSATEAGKMPTAKSTDAPAAKMSAAAKLGTVRKRRLSLSAR